MISQTSQDSSDFVSVAEAARRLGISTSTVRRRIAAGALEAEQLQRAQGLEYRVRLQREVPGTSHARSDSEETAPLTGISQDLSAAITAAVAPLLERLVVADATIADQTVALRALERDVATLAERLTHVEQDRDAARADLEASDARYAALLARTEPHPLGPAPAASWHRWRVLAPWLLSLVALMSVVVLLGVSW